MYSLAIIIPCFNEAERLDQQEFICFANHHPDILLVFTDDGSKDDTIKVLELIKGKTNGTIEIVALKNNKGKGFAVREGLLYVLRQYNPMHIGYLDADLSISFEEFLRLYTIGVQEEADIVLGSKIRKIDTEIKRSTFRHIIARVIATIIDNKFKLGCYDTQCGAKIFKPAVIKEGIDQPFLTGWFFDVELLVRIIRSTSNVKALEIPLRKCNTMKNSKINPFSSISILKELYILLTKY